jgi:hypothetical protein
MAEVLQRIVQLELRLVAQIALGAAQIGAAVTVRQRDGGACRRVELHPGARNNRLNRRRHLAWCRHRAHRYIENPVAEIFGIERHDGAARRILGVDPLHRSRRNSDLFAGKSIAHRGTNDVRRSTAARATPWSKSSAIPQPCELDPTPFCVVEADALDRLLGRRVERSRARERVDPGISVSSNDTSDLFDILGGWSAASDLDSSDFRMGSRISLKRARWLSCHMPVCRARTSAPL